MSDCAKRSRVGGSRRPNLSGQEVKDVKNAKELEEWGASRRRGELQEEVLEDAREGVDDEEGGEPEEGAKGELILGCDGQA